MSLSPRQRYGAFFIGVGIGCVLITIYFNIRGMPQAPAPPPPGVIRREVPGVFLQMMAEGKPVEGSFVLSQMDSRAGGGSGPMFYRSAVVPGLDPGAFILVLEYSTFENPDRVAEWKFMFADHIRARLKPDADTRALAQEMEKLGWHFAGGKDKDGWVTILLKDHNANSLQQAEWQLQQWPQWVDKSEPDFLPLPSLPGANPPH